MKNQTEQSQVIDAAKVHPNSLKNLERGKRFQKGESPLKHKRGCRCFRCSKTPWNKGLKLPQQQNENSPMWKGDRVGYNALHSWVSRNLGKATYCSFNPVHKAKRYVWANKSHQYKRDLDDWMSLCPSCHTKYDFTEETRKRAKISQKKAQAYRAKKVTLNNQTRTLEEWSKVTGLNISTMRVRRWMGYTPEEILAPAKRKRNLKNKL